MLLLITACLNLDGDSEICRSCGRNTRGRFLVNNQCQCKYYFVCHLEHELDDNTLAFTDYLDNPTEHRFNFSKVTENEIVVIINNLKTKNSSRKDEISNKLLKSIKGEISKPLTIIINQCLGTGIFFKSC